LNADIVVGKAIDVAGNVVNMFPVSVEGRVTQGLAEPPASVPRLSAAQMVFPFPACDQ
jgi:hypothetical protein